MLLFGRVGQSARVHYNARRAPHMPHDGRIGRLVIVSRGKPRNHGVEIDGRIACVPCGNLYAIGRPN